MVLTAWSRRWFAYVLAVGGVVLATACRYALNPVLGTRVPYAVYYFALIPIASRLGAGPALVALGLSTATGVYCFVEPIHDWGVSTWTEVTGLILFVLVNLVVIGYAEDSRVARQGLEREVAERVQAEAALRAAKHTAEDANRAKDRFIAVVSHELRTPLNPVALTVRALLGRDDHSDEIRRDLEAIAHYVDLEVRLIDDLLDVVRISRDQLTLEWTVLDLHQVVEEAGRAALAEMVSLGLRLEVQLQAARHHVHADPNRLRQVLANLLRNAAKFTPRGGTVILRTSNATAPTRSTEGRRVVAFQEESSVVPVVSPASEGQTDQVVVEVADTGIGIEPAELARIFEPFSQANPAVSRRFGGLGLGLSICVGIVEGHGGTLQARSEGRNRGTTLAVRLPLVPAPTTSSDYPVLTSSSSDLASSALASELAPAGLVLPLVSDPTDEADLSRLRVLIVEDEPATIRVMTRLLRNRGHRVTTAVNLAEAITWVDGATRFDLLVSDIGLPDGSGLDLMRRTRQIRPDLPAIALTGFGTDADIEQSRLAGFTAHMTKPIDFDQLATLIDRVAVIRPEAKI